MRRKFEKSDPNEFIRYCFEKSFYSKVKNYANIKPDLKNPNFFVENYFYVLADCENIDGFEILRKSEDCTTYFEKKERYIDDETRKMNRIKHVGFLNYGFNEVIYCLIDKDYNFCFENFIDFSSESFDFQTNCFSGCSLVNHKIKLGKFLKSRQLPLSITMMQEINRNKIIIIWKSVNYLNKITKYPNHVTAKSVGYCVLEEVEKNKTKFYYSAMFDFGGWTKSNFYLRYLKKNPFNKNRIENFINSRKELGLKTPKKNRKLIECLETFKNKKIKK